MFWLDMRVVNAADSVVSRFNSLELQFPSGPWHSRLLVSIKVYKIQGIMYTVSTPLDYHRGSGTSGTFVPGTEVHTKYKGFFIGAAIGR